MKQRSLIISTILGVSAAIVTGFIPTAFMAGATHYGFPLTWRIQLILSPEHYPWVYDYPMLILDSILWVLLFTGILYLVQRKN